ncbi:MAG: NAD(P)H-hydrate epimerase [Phycisphaerales bacterium]
MIKKFDMQNDPVMTRQEVRDFDTYAINTLGIPGIILMENAGRGCSEIIIEKLKTLLGSKVCIFCGTGNNGGDGFVIARHLVNAGFDVIVVLCGNSAKIKGDAEVNYKIAANMKINIREFFNVESIKERLQELAADSDLIVDAIFGTGLSGELKPEFAQVIDAINTLNKPVVAVDIPSGLDCDEGIPLNKAIKATATVTFVSAKKGFLNPHSRHFTGEVYVASIGIEPTPTNRF